MLGILLASALLCGLLVRRRGAPLLAALDAPDLLERLQRHRGFVAGSLLAALLVQPIALALLLGPDVLTIDLALPLLVGGGTIIWAGVAAGDLPLRRAVLGETWGLGAYLCFWTRLYLALAGFWFALVAGPWLTRAWPGPAWAGGLVTLALLGTWLAGHERLIRGLLRARPMPPGPLRERLERIAGSAHCTAPRIDVFGAAGASWCNAFALPHRRRPGVLFTGPLLDRLDDDATAAVFAHELAHLEEHDARSLRRLGALLGVLCVLSSMGQPLLELASPSAAAWYPLFWLIGLLGIVIVRVSRSRGHETQSDLRAIELCGDADALIRGLTELHVANAMPRRWRAETERMSTHPSLARRIQAIRAAAGAAQGAAPDVPTAPVAPLLLRARGDARRALLLDERGAHWLEGLPEPAGPDDLELAEKRHTLVYGELIELQLESRRGGAVLRAQTRRGEKLELPLDDADVGPLQAQLDRIDDRLAPIGGSGPLQDGVVALAAFCAAVGALPLLLGDGRHAVWPLVLLVLALVVMLRRRRPELAALGALSLATGLFLAGGGSGLTGLQIAGLLGVLGGGIACLRLARPGREAALGAGRPRAVAAVLGALAVPGLLGALVALGSDPAPTHLLAYARASSFGLLPLFGASAALWSARGRPGPLVALLGMFGLAPLIAGHPAALTRWVHDPLAAAAPPIAREPSSVQVRIEHTLDAPFRGLKISPGAALAAAGSGSDAHHGDAFAIVDLSSGQRREVEALALAFVDDTRVLLVRGPRESPRLALVLAGRPDADLWTLALPPLGDAHWIELGAHGERWWLERRGDTETLRLSGRAGSDEIEQRSWSAPADHWVIPAAGPAALQVRWRTGPASGPLQPLGALLASGMPGVDLGWDGGEPVHSALTVECHGPLDGGPAVLCLATDGERSWLWHADTRTARLELLARSEAGLAARWTGTQLVRLTRDALLVDDPRAGRGQRLALPAPVDVFAELAVADDAYAVSWPVDGGARRRIAILAAD